MPRKKEMAQLSFSELKGELFNFQKMNRKAPLLPIFNCKKRSREAIIAEPQEQFVSSSHDGRYNNLGIHVRTSIFQVFV